MSEEDPPIHTSPKKQSPLKSALQKQKVSPDHHPTKNSVRVDDSHNFNSGTEEHNLNSDLIKNFQTSQLFKTAAINPNIERDSPIKA
jgi:hypothetical protein